MSAEYMVFMCKQRSPERILVSLSQCDYLLCHKRTAELLYSTVNHGSGLRLARHRSTTIGYGVAAVLANYCIVVRPGLTLGLLMW